MTALRRWRGLAALLRDAVEHGSRAVERVQRRTARRSFAVLERVPLLARPARGVHLVHEVTLVGVHGAIRLVGSVVGEAASLAFDAVERRGTPPDATPPGATPPGATPPGATGR